ncbi:hypothetical protein B0H11DRAFT_1946672 [Mycena galericulata]|nr:hypothetical protein B0H11DRAFT_1946672 [Mycena galericulata]
MPLSVAQLEANATDLRTFCETTPGMNALQPIAASTVEICSAAATLVGNESDGLGAVKLVTYVVDKTEFLINKIAQGSLSPEICEALEMHEEKLDAIRRHFENTPVLPRKKTSKFILFSRFKRETRRLKADLKSHLRVIVTICDGKSAEAKGTMRSEDVVEYVSVGARAVGAICDVPVLNVMKPVFGIVTLICDTAKCVHSNREAALNLAARASTVTRSIVDRSAMDGAATHDPEALDTALEDIQSYLTALKKPRRRLSSWILANQEKDRFAKLDGALSNAVALFSTTQALRTAGEVRVNGHTTAALVTTVGHLNTRLTVMQADFGRLSIETPVHHKNNSFRTILTPSNVRLIFFFRPARFRKDCGP